MKAITIWQPWASLLACGAKKFETRSWETHYRGPIAIHASAKSIKSVLKEVFPCKDWDFHPSSIAFSRFDGAIRASGLSLYNLPTGCVIATAELKACWKITDNGHTNGSLLAARIEGGMYGGKTNIVEGKEIFFGDWTPGRYAWELVNVIMLPEPIPVKGRQGLWNWEG